MSVRVSTRVWAQSKAKGSALLLLLAIADYANDSNLAWPSVDTLSRKIRMTRRNTQILLRQLEASGELEVRSGAGPGGTHLYRVKLGESATDVQGENSSPAQSFRGVRESDAEYADGAKNPADQRRSHGRPNRNNEPSIPSDPSTLVASAERDETGLTTLAESGWEPAITTQLAAWSDLNAPGVALDHEIRKFKHYFTRGIGARRVGEQWERVLEAWLLRATKYDRGGAKRNGPNKPTGQHRPAAIAAYPAASGGGSVIIRGGRHTHQPEPEDRDR